ncbi:MAG: hypothetical protein JWN32_577, partial [Solirubrobacterales bacterium]|nr:hypothetical protein [Solirubrobacterales bacterium]
MRTLRLLLPLLVLAASLVAVPVATASDVRTSDTSDRLFYGTPVTVDATGFATDSTAEPGAPSGTQISCATFSGGPFNRTVGHTAWYRIVGTGGSIDISTAGSSYDTVLSIYTQGGTTPLACQDDVASGDSTSKIAAFASSANTVYEVQVGNYNNNACPTGGCQLH